MTDKYALTRYFKNGELSYGIIAQSDENSWINDEIADLDGESSAPDALRVLIAPANENVARQKADAEKAKKEAEEKAAKDKRDRARLFDSLLSSPLDVLDVNSLYPSPFYDLDALRAKLDASANYRIRVAQDAPNPIPEPENALRQWAEWLDSRIASFGKTDTPTVNYARRIYKSLIDGVNERLVAAQNDPCCLYITPESLDALDREMKNNIKRTLNRGFTLTERAIERQAVEVGALKMAADRLNAIRRGR